MLRIITITCFLALISGCGNTRHEVSIDQPGVYTYTHTEKARGFRIYLDVQDGRDTTRAGTRGIMGANIDATSIFPLFESAAQEMFTAKGYLLVSEDSADAKVTMHLRKVIFDYSLGGLTQYEHAHVSVSVTASRAVDLDGYKNLYKSSKKEMRFIVAFGEEINEKLSDRVADVLRMIANDGDLHAYLTDE